MADSVISSSVEKIRAFWHSQVHDPDRWDHNKKLLCAFGLFGGSVLVMRSYGDMMAI